MGWVGFCSIFYRVGTEWQTEERTERRTEGRTKGRTEERTEGRTKVRTEGRTEGRVVVGWGTKSLSRTRSRCHDENKRLHYWVPSFVVMMRTKSLSRTRSRYHKLGLGVMMTSIST